jgi:hypothetical protein
VDVDVDVDVEVGEAEEAGEASARGLRVEREGAKRCDRCWLPRPLIRVRERRRLFFRDMPRVAVLGGEAGGAP